MGVMTEIVLPVALAFIMFSLGLGLTFDDFVRVATRPRDFLVGARFPDRAPAGRGLCAGKCVADFSRTRSRRHDHCRRAGRRHLQHLDRIRARRCRVVDIPDGGHQPAQCHHDPHRGCLVVRAFHGRRQRGRRFGRRNGGQRLPCGNRPCPARTCLAALRRKPCGAFRIAGAPDLGDPFRSRPGGRHLSGTRQRRSVLHGRRP